MATLNRCEFIGNLGKDPEVRSLNDGKKVANLSVACTESWKKDGEKKERTEWVRAVLWGPLAEIAEKYLHKGSKVYISGSMQTRKWQDKDGTDKYSTEIVLQGFDSKLIMLDWKRGDTADTSDQATPPSQNGGDNVDDEIPF